MSNTNNIKELLNIEDQNIHFEEECVTTELKKGFKCKIIRAKLDYTPAFCPKCGVVKDELIVRHGLKKSDIKIPSVSRFKTYLRLFKQRWKCDHCHSTFFCVTNIVDKNCFISNTTRYAIAEDLTEIVSEKSIAKKNNVSHTTVSKIITSHFDNKKLYKHFLPKVLCFDEFKSVRKCRGNMSFLMVDFIERKPIDIVEDRRLYSLENYFSYYTPEARNMVQFIVIDMYDPYISLIKKMFPNAKIVIDKFHIVNLISRSLNKTRIKVMKDNKKNYKKLKRYWRLPLKYRGSLDCTKYRRFTCFHNFKTEEQVTDFIINSNDEMKNTYWLYQKILAAIKNKDSDYFREIIHLNHEGISDYMKTSIKSLRLYEDYVVNALETDYTNGVIEGINNKIKVIKRVSFGYRSYFKFKRRILICFNLIQTKKRLDFSI